MTRTVVLLGTLDTKGPEAAFLRDCVAGHGATPVLVDIGHGGQPQANADVDASDVARAVGRTIDEIRTMPDTGAASALMMQGAIVLVTRMYRESHCDAVIGFGGASNATLATGVMKALPVGVPKLMISSAAALPAYAASWFGSRDITMMSAVVDISGLNDLTRAILRQGAAAVCAMAECGGVTPDELRGTRLVAVSSFRFAETCSQAVMTRLEQLGYSPIPFHAQGVGENAMEDLLRSGLFRGVVDIVPAGLSEQMLGGNRAARPDRLEAAADAGIPQVVATAGFDMISCGPISRRDSGDELWQQRGLAARRYCVPDRFRVEARTTADEVAEIGRAVGAKLARAGGLARMFVATQGWSSLSVAGADLHDPDADAAFVPAFRETAGADVALREIDAALNSELFAGVLADALHSMLRDAGGAATRPAVRE